MPAVREFLLRLRPAGAPGSAGPAGVPADAGARAADELEPVFAALAPAVREAGRIRDQAQRQAVQITATANERARALLAQARADAVGERARVAAELTAQAGQDVSRFLERAGEEAAEVEREANGRRAERVALVIGRVRQQLSGLDGR